MTLLSFLFIVNILLFKKCLMDEQKYFLIPFSIQKEKEYSSEEYNINLFIQNNFYRNITFEFYIGTPPQKSTGIIINDNRCFELKLSEELYSYNNFFNYINNKYRPKDSSTFSVNHKELRWNKGQYMTLGSDLFNFGDEKNYNLTFLFKKTEEEGIDVNKIENQKYITKFGLNALTSFSGDECPNFISDMRNKARLSKYLISFSFSNINTGHLVIGDELYNYNSKIYHKSQYNGAYTVNPNIINHNKELIIDSNNNKDITLNLTYAYLQYDLGVIIGTNEYKKIIDENFFNKLISEKICQINVYKLNETDYYYVYTCNENNLNLKLFPKILFTSASYLFNFELNYKDLFVKKYDNKYYFLVLFKVNNETNSTNIKEEWKMGSPFYKKYNFTINLDARMVGFYNPNIDFEEDKEINNENKTNINNNNDNKDADKTTLIIIFSILGSVFVALLMFLSFYFGMKIKEGRKKRANELKEDNYEYYQEESKDENKLIN